MSTGAALGLLVVRLLIVPAHGSLARGHGMTRAVIGLSSLRRSGGASEAVSASLADLRSKPTDGSSGQLYEHTAFVAPGVLLFAWSSDVRRC